MSTETTVADTTRTVFMLSDETIMMVAKLLQLAIITQTSLVDNFRTIRLEPSKEDGTKLVTTPEYEAWFEEGVKLLEEKAKVLLSKMEATKTETPQ